MDKYVKEIFFNAKEIPRNYIETTSPKKK